LNNSLRYDCTVIIPAYFPDDKILDNINSIPQEVKIIIVDNSYDHSLLAKIKKISNCEYYNIGDVGLGKTFNFALQKVKTKFMLLTQPDVVLRKKCLENLIVGINKYEGAGIVVPIVYDLGHYSKYDFYDLKYSKLNKTFNQKNLKNKKNIFPAGDFCVDAVNATTMLIRTDAIKKIGGWDNNIYVYHEDIDICLRMYLNNYYIVKIFDAVVDHQGWSSHFLEIKNTMNLTRVWHFTWSSIYFNFKFCNKVYASIFFLKVLIKAICKFLVYGIFYNKEKFKINIIRLSACFAFFFKRGSYFRIRHNIK